jgi:hypothetical protein
VTWVELMAQITRARPTPPRKLSPGVPKALERVCLKALSAEPVDRFPDGAAFADALVEANAPVRNGQFLKVIGVIGALALAAGLGFLARGTNQPASEPPIAATTTSTPSPTPAPPSEASTPAPPSEAPTPPAETPPAKPQPLELVMTLAESSEEKAPSVRVRWIDGDELITFGGGAARHWKLGASAADLIQEWPAGYVAVVPGRRILINGADGGRLIDLDTGGALPVSLPPKARNFLVRPHLSKLRLAVSTRKGLLVSGLSDDGTTQFTRLASRSEFIGCFDLSPDGSLAVVCEGGGVLSRRMYQWDFVQAKYHGQSTMVPIPYSAVAFSDRFLAQGTSSGILTVTDRSSGATRVLEPGTFSVRDDLRIQELAFDSDARLWSTSRKHVKAWDPTTGDILFSLDVSGTGASAQPAPTAALLAVGHLGRAEIWRVPRR